MEDHIITKRNFWKLISNTENHWALSTRKANQAPFLKPWSALKSHRSQWGLSETMDCRTGPWNMSGLVQILEAKNRLPPPPHPAQNYGCELTVNI